MGAGISLITPLEVGGLLNEDDEGGLENVDDEDGGLLNVDDDGLENVGAACPVGLGGLEDC